MMRVDEPTSRLRDVIKAGDFRAGCPRWRRKKRFRSIGSPDATTWVDKPTSRSGQEPEMFEPAVRAGGERRDFDSLAVPIPRSGSTSRRVDLVESRRCSSRLSALAEKEEISIYWQSRCHDLGRRANRFGQEPEMFEPAVRMRGRKRVFDSLAVPMPRSGRRADASCDEELETLESMRTDGGKRFQFAGSPNAATSADELKLGLSKSRRCSSRLFACAEERVFDSLPAPMPRTSSTS